MGETAPADGATGNQPGEDGADPQARAHRRHDRRATGTAIAVAVAALVLWFWHASDQFVPSAAGQSIRVLGINLALAVGIGLVVWLILHFALRRLVRLPALLIAVCVGALFLLVTLGPGTSRLAWFGLIVVVLLCAGVLGWSLGSWLSGSRRTPMITAGIAVLALAGLFAWLLSPTGSAPARPQLSEPTTLYAGADPAEPGTFGVQRLTYGSGTDRLRPEYGADATVTTSTVDLSDVITGWSDGAGSARTDVWGFDASELPINGRVWYPDGEGPFPLVLVVHGNKSTVEFSELGYSYLGELLASRGMVVASIDENFLNTNLLDRTGGIGGADAARALLILEHLKAWQQIAGEGELAGKVDLERIGLVGHSRGGGAVASAAWLNTLDALPDNPEHALSYGYSIKAVVGLAPADGQYTPDGQKPTLTDVSYLAVQGSDDVDVASFGGLNQLERTSLSAGQIAGAVYIDGADHSQFNSRWGRRDIGDGATKYFVNTGALISPETQRDAAATFVSAFLGTTLTGTDDIRPLLADNRAGADLLPGVSYLTQLREGGAAVFLDAQDDDDAATGPDGTVIASDGLSDWSEDALALRWGADDGRAVTVAGPGRLRVTPAGPVDLSAARELRVDLAMVDPGAGGSVLLSVRDAAGSTQQIELTDVPAPFVAHPLKAGWMQQGAASEPVLQTRSVPLVQLTEVDTTSIVELSVTIDDGTEVYVDNLAASA